MWNRVNSYTEGQQVGHHHVSAPVVYIAYRMTHLHRSRATHEVIRERSRGLCEFFFSALRIPGRDLSADKDILLVTVPSMGSVAWHTVAIVRCA